MQVSHLFKVQMMENYLIEKFDESKTKKTSHLKTQICATFQGIAFTH